VPIYVELRDGRGQPIRGLPDPSGGTFDVAGDFDRFVDEDSIGHRAGLELPTLKTVDPYGDTKMPTEVMGALLGDISKVLPFAKQDPNCGPAATSGAGGTVRDRS
jgi:hypothetical protein